MMVFFMRTCAFLMLTALLAVPPLQAQPRPTGKAKKFAHLEQVAARKHLKVLHIPIEGEMSDATTALIRRGAQETRAQKMDVVLLDIHTPGGSLMATQLMCSEMTKLSDSGVLTIAYVRHSAWSAGALLALSCEFIVMHGSGSIGSAKPFLMGQGQSSESMDEKLNSAVRADFRAIAQRMGHSPTLAMAMVDQALQVYEVTVDGRKRYLTADQIDEIHHAKDVTQGPVVCRKGQLLNLTAQEALNYQLAATVADSPEALLKQWGLHADQQRTLRASWSEHLAGWLSSGFVVMLLLVIGGLGIYLEMSSPGFGFPGLIGLTCIVLLLFGKYLAGLAQVADILLILTGILLLAVEVLVIPGFGVAGISGLLCLALGLILSLQSFALPQNELQSEILQRNAVVVLASLGFVLTGMFVMIRFLSLAPGFNRLIHSAVQDETYIVAEPELAELNGKIGTTSTKLRPSGKAKIGGQHVDVISNGEFIESGASIRVVSVKGAIVTVEQA